MKSKYNTSGFLSSEFLLVAAGILSILLLAMVDKATVENVGAITGLIVVYTGGRSYVKGNGKGGE